MISKKERNVAIVWALTRADGWIGWIVPSEEIISRNRLAERCLDAFQVVRTLEIPDDWWWASQWLEVAALLRDGWSPGDGIRWLT